MSFKLVLDVGFFDATGEVVQLLDAAFVQQMIVQAGGQLPEQKPRWRLALGFLGPEVVLNRGGQLSLALGYGPNPAALAFLRVAVAAGCTIWTEDGESTESVLANLAATEARWAALKKAWPGSR